MHKKGYKISVLCKITGISRATFYYQKDNTRKTDKDLETLEIIKMLPEKQLRYAGAKVKVHYLKLQFGIKMNHKRILRVSNLYGIHVENRVRRFPKGYYQTLKENDANLPKNILNREFSADKPLQKLVTDISYFKIKNGWLFLSAVMDLFNKEILAFRMSNTPSISIVKIARLLYCALYITQPFETSRGISSLLNAHFRGVRTARST